MRTDVNVITDRPIRCPNMCSLGSGIAGHVQRGFMIRWKTDASISFGRVIGTIDYAPPIGDEKLGSGPWVVVAAMSWAGYCYERWVDPDDVTDCCSEPFADKVAWLFSDAFLETPADLARQCFDKTVEQLTGEKP